MNARRPSRLALTRGLLDIVLMGLVAVILLAVFLGRGVQLLGAQSLIIGGPSMEPTLPLGSAVIILPVDPDSIAVGDIVSVKSGAETAIFTHRVVRLLTLQGEPYIETKGDNNPTPDGATVPASAVIGRVAWSIPLMGYVIALLSVPSGVAFVLGLGALLILAALLVDSVDADRRVARPAMTTIAGAHPSVPAVASSIDLGPAAVAALVRGRRRERTELGTEPATAVARHGRPRRRRAPKPTA